MYFLKEEGKFKTKSKNLIIAATKYNIYQYTKL